MSATPNLDELKVATNTGKLVDAFRLLITHDKAEEEGFIARIGEESSQLREVIIKKSKQSMRHLSITLFSMPWQLLVMMLSLKYN